jgi:hypothetical protein
MREARAAIAASQLFLLRMRDEPATKPLSFFSKNATT